ncbi:unnamed protein product [Calicophoron daubneyi]|uniref:Uncharacterized protein n=1 Tax=Calicophoron daubneyi TaxID=300641 RepID=A0AAV2T878_CALDB
MSTNTSLIVTHFLIVWYGSRMSVSQDVALYELVLKAGLTISDDIFRHIHGLLALGCNPDVIFDMLKYLTSTQARGGPNERVLRQSYNTLRQSSRLGLDSGFSQMDPSGDSRPIPRSRNNSVRSLRNAT